MNRVFSIAGVPCFPLSLLGLMILSGCQTQPPPAPSAAASVLTPADAVPVLKKVTLALNWFPEAEHGGYYAALTRGYYREAGLDVEIIPGGPKVPVLQQVASGQVDFVVDNADKLLLARAQQANIVAVMCPIQNSPRCLIVHESLGVTRLEELAKRSDVTFAMNAGQPFAQFLVQTLNLKQPVIPYPGNIAQFLLNEKLAQQAYSFSEPFVAQREGAKVRTLMLSELGFNTYTSLLVAQGSRLSQDPELVEKLVVASIRGWQDYLKNPVDTNVFLHEKNPEMSFDVLEYGVEVLKPLCLPETMSTESLGQMSAERWATLVEQMEASGSLDRGAVKADECYSLKFLKSATSAN